MRKSVHRSCFLTVPIRIATILLGPPSHPHTTTTSLHLFTISNTYQHRTSTHTLHISKIRTPKPRVKASSEMAPSDPPRAFPYKIANSVPLPADGEKPKHVYRGPGTPHGQVLGAVHTIKRHVPGTNPPNYYAIGDLVQCTFLQSFLFPSNL